MKVTINDVAKIAGVSKTSVSFYLNDKGDLLSKETQKKISDSIKKLNYVPNRSARNLSVQKSGFIALLVPNLTNPFYSNLAQHLLNNIEEKNIELVILNFPEYELGRRKVLKLLNNSSFDGALIISSQFDEIINEMYDKKVLKFIFLDEMIDGKDISIITGDSEYGGYLVGDYLIKNGHINIACITGPKNTPNSTNRLKGIKSRFKINKLSIKSENIIYGDYTFLGGYNSVKELDLKNISAIFCFNDLMAFGVIKGLKERGIRTPEDISVIGYDNLPMNEYMSPLLTTVDQHINVIAREAINNLINLIEKGGDAKKMLIKPTLIEGKTVKNKNK